jgi:hypothetical protein
MKRFIQIIGLCFTTSLMFAQDAADDTQPQLAGFSLGYRFSALPADNYFSPMRANNNTYKDYVAEYSEYDDYDESKNEEEWVRLLKQIGSGVGIAAPIGLKAYSIYSYNNYEKARSPLVAEWYYDHANISHLAATAFLLSATPAALKYLIPGIFPSPNPDYALIGAEHSYYTLPYNISYNTAFPDSVFSMPKKSSGVAKRYGISKKTTTYKLAFGVESLKVKELDDQIQNFYVDGELNPYLLFKIYEPYIGASFIYGSGLKGDAYDSSTGEIIEDSEHIIRGGGFYGGIRIHYPFSTFYADYGVRGFYARNQDGIPSHNMGGANDLVLRIGLMIGAII